MSTGGLDRRQMFAYLSSLGLTVPYHGSPQEVAVYLADEYPGIAHRLFDVVVYDDLNLHRGLGKRKVKLSVALDSGNVFVSHYIPSYPGSGSTSLRYLQVGNAIFWLRYFSDGWRSNYGDVNVEVLCREEDKYHPRIHIPLFAVDFVPGNKMYAVDFNTAPGLDPIRDLMDAKEVVQRIKSALEMIPKAELDKEDKR